MESFKYFEYIFAIANFIIGLASIIILTAAIILVYKEKSIQTYTLLVGSVLSVLFIAIRYVYKLLTGLEIISSDNMLKYESIFSICETFSFLILGIGLLMISINSFKKNSTP